MESDILTFTDKEVVNRIIKVNEGLADFWSNASGWASIEAAALLTKSRLDWQASLSRQLRVFLDTENKKESGALILAWCLLGSLIEGTMKLFLSVWYDDYKVETIKEDIRAIKDKEGSLIDPDCLALEKLRVFFLKRIYKKDIRKIWRSSGETDWIDWVLFIQNKRNAIHAFKDRDIGDFDVFFHNLRLYLQFIRNLTDGLPYPEVEYGSYKPSEV